MARLLVTEPADFVGRFCDCRQAFTQSAWACSAAERLDLAFPPFPFFPFPPSLQPPGRLLLTHRLKEVEEYPFPYYSVLIGRP